MSEANIAQLLRLECNRCGTRTVNLLTVKFTGKDPDDEKYNKTYFDLLCETCLKNITPDQRVQEIEEKRKRQTEIWKSREASHPF